MTIINVTAGNTLTPAQEALESTIIPLTSKTGEVNSLLAKSFTLGFGAIENESVKNRTASNTLSLSQDADVEKSKPVTGSNTLTFTQTNSREGSFSQTGANNLTLNQTNIRIAPIAVTGNNSLSFTQNQESGLLTRTASNELIFTQFGHSGGEIEVTASNNLNLVQNASPGLLTRTASDELILEELNNRTLQEPNAIALTASDSLTFSQTNNRVNIRADGITLTADNDLTFVQRAIFPLELTANNLLTFVQSSSGNPGKNATDTLVFTQSAIANKISNYTASDTLNLKQSFVWAKFRNGLPVNDERCGATQQYSPFSSGSTIRPIPTVLTKHNDVLFYYPTGAICDATDSFTLRTPNFNDRDRNTYNRINRESRGGTLIVFRDPKWPKERTLVMDYSGIKDDQVDSILTFFETTLGKKIGFRDWNGRLWYGIISNPDTPIIRTGKDRNDVSIEIDIDDPTLELQACDVLQLTQTNDYELIPV